MRIHLETQRLKERLAADINQSGLPAICARMVVEDLAAQLRDQEVQALQLEAQAETREKQQQAAQQAAALAEAKKQKRAARKQAAAKKEEPEKEASHG